MEMKESMQAYIDLLREELVPALGCTEPIAIAYASAVAARELGAEPERLHVRCSGNIIKNVKSVTVPNSGGQKGIEAAAVLGAVGGNADKQLEVLADITPAHIERSRELVREGRCTVGLLEGARGSLGIALEASGGGHTVLVEIADAHTNIVDIQVDGRTVFHKERGAQDQGGDRSFLSLDGILDFAEKVDLALVEDLIQRQIDCNTAISQEGLARTYGASVGQSLLEAFGEDVKVRAKACAAAGSDARMSGCEMPVIINSGSGNQGMTVSLPVIEYARELDVPRKKLIRALLISNLVAIHQKSLIGKLSAYCGAVSAACGSGAAITYLHGGDRERIANTIVNTLGNVSGIVCDGAKPSCAAKIASSVDAAIMAHVLSMKGKAFCGGEGIVKQDVEETIRSVGRLAKDGMRQTDVEVLHIMVDS